jgi:uncharacterized protein
VDRKIFQQVIHDFRPIKDQLDPLAIVLFGSQTTENLDSSDIDICIVLPNTSISKSLSVTWKLLGDKYDVKIFEELPLYIQADVIENHLIIYADNEVELFEYWYKFRKHINTYHHRLKVAYSEYS